MTDCEILKETMTLDRQLEPAEREHFRTCVGCAREWRAHRALIEHHAAARPPRVPVVPPTLPGPSRRGSDRLTSFGRAIAVLRAWAVASIVVSGWILQAKMPEAAGSGALGQAAFFVGIVGLGLLALAPMRSILRLLAGALRL